MDIRNRDQADLPEKLPFISGLGIFVIAVVAIVALLFVRLLTIESPPSGEIGLQRIDVLDTKYLSEHELSQVSVIGYLVRMPDTTVNVRGYDKASYLSTQTGLSTTHLSYPAAIYQMYWDSSLTGPSVTIFQSIGDRYGPLENLTAPNNLSETPLIIYGQIVWDDYSQSWMVRKINSEP